MPRFPASAVPLERREGSCVAVTGMGLMTCLGSSVDQTWNEVRAGHTGIRLLSALESSSPDGPTGGEVAGPLPGAEPVGPVEVVVGDHRVALCLRHAIREALRDAGFERIEFRGPTGIESGGAGLFAGTYSPDRVGLILGTTLHGMRSGGRYLRNGNPAELRGFLAGSILQEILPEAGSEGPAWTTCSACSSGLSAIISALTLLESRDADLMIAGGYDPISEYAYAGFKSMRLVSPTRPRPFTAERDGMCVGEGYGILILERPESAQRRGARIRAILAGHGTSSDAHHLSQPDPTGTGAVAAIRQALWESGREPADVDLIVAHGTATRDNDAAEATALTSVFGDQLPGIPTVAFKSHLGHTLGAAGAVEMILAIQAMNEGTIPPCAHRSEPLRVLDGLSLSAPPARKAKLSTVLCTSLGFGGSNACVVIESAEGLRLSANDPVEPTEAPHRMPDSTVVVSGIGVVLPGVLGLEALGVELRRSSPSTDLVALEMSTDALNELVSAPRTRRMSQYAKLTLASAELAFRDARVNDPRSFAAQGSAVLGTTHGAARHCESYYRQLIAQGLDTANPLLFAEGVPNVAAAHLSTTYGVRGFCQTIIGTRTAGLDALRVAHARIATGRWERALVSTAEELSPVIREAYTHLGLHRADLEIRRRSRHPGFLMGEGSVTLVLERLDSARNRGARIHTVIESVAGFGPSPRPGWAVRSGLRRTLQQLGDFSTCMLSVNGTWIDDLERGSARGALRRSGVEDWPTRILQLGPGFPETFSVTPLVGLAAMITRFQPSVMTGPTGSERERSVESTSDSLQPPGTPGIETRGSRAFESSQSSQGRFDPRTPTDVRGSDPLMDVHRGGGFVVLGSDYHGAVAGVRARCITDG